MAIDSVSRSATTNPGLGRELIRSFGNSRIPNLPRPSIEQVATTGAGLTIGYGAGTAGKYAYDGLNNDKIIPTEYPFLGGQSSGIPYNVVFSLTSNEPATIISSGIVFGRIAGIGWIGDNYGIIGSDGQNISYGHHRSAVDRYGYSMKIISVERVDGRPDTGGNPPPIRLGYTETYVSPSARPIPRIADKGVLIFPDDTDPNSRKNNVTTFPPRGVIVDVPPFFPNPIYDEDGKMITTFPREDGLSLKFPNPPGEPKIGESGNLDLGSLPRGNPTGQGRGTNSLSPALNVPINGEETDLTRYQDRHIINGPIDIDSPEITQQDDETKLIPTFNRDQGYTSRELNLVGEGLKRLEDEPSSDLSTNRRTGLSPGISSGQITSTSRRGSLTSTPVNSGNSSSGGNTPVDPDKDKCTEPDISGTINNVKCAKFEEIDNSPDSWNFSGKGLIGVKEEVLALSKLVGEVKKDICRLEVVSGIPETWPQKGNSQIPQLIVIFVEYDKKNKKWGKTPYEMKIPHYSGGKKPTIGSYTKGRYCASLRLTDNSRLTVNAKTKKEASSFYKSLLPLIDKQFLPGITDIEPIKRADSLKEVLVYPRTARYFPRGVQKAEPEWIYYFAIPSSS